MNAIRCVAGVLAIGVGLWLTLATTPRSGTGDSSPGPSSTPARANAFVPHRGAELPLHGLAIHIHSAEQAAQRYGRLVGQVADLGADTVMLSINGYQEHVDSVRIEASPTFTPTDADLLSLFAAAHRLGLRVILMPKILLSDPRGGAWRGQIKPPSWDAWFGQYRRFLRHYARLAERGNVEMFILGSELVSTEKLTAHWEETIAQVRAEYGGMLAYSANWDHYSSVQFWDKLDLVGMTTYYRLADKPGPSVDELLAKWNEIRRDILAFQAEVGRPLLFTEAGWCSQEGCSVEAWNYYRQEEATTAGLEEQRRNYEAFVKTWADEPAVGGIIWWEWTDCAGGAGDYGYTPRHKPAEAVLRELFGREW